MCGVPTNRVGTPQFEYRETSMIKPGKTLGTAMVVSVMLAALAGCQKQEGPVERAGKEVDKVVEKAGQQVEKAGENIQDVAKGEKK